MNAKRIDQLTETIDSVAQLDGTELLLTSVRDSNAQNGFVSKKMSLSTLKTFVNSSGLGGGPFLIFNEDDSSDYVWHESIASSGTDSTPITRFNKTVSHDCLVVLGENSGSNTWHNDSLDSDGLPYWHRYEEVHIDDVLINAFAFRLGPQQCAFYLKKGQNIKVITRYNGNSYNRISLFPIDAGGVFIDTNKMKQEEYLENGEWKYNLRTYESGENISFPFDAIFIGTIPNRGITNQDYQERYSAKIGNRFVITPFSAVEPLDNAMFYLRAGQEISHAPAGGIKYYCAYPILL